MPLKTTGDKAIEAVTPVGKENPEAIQTASEAVRWRQ